MKLRTAIVAAFAVAISTSAANADPIEGTWLRPSTGTIVRYAKQGDQFCGTVQTGEYEGKSIGCMKAAASGYTGKVIALDEGKTYTGKASVSGNTMNLKGCVAGGLICKGEDWQRQ